MSSPTITLAVRLSLVDIDDDPELQIDRERVLHDLHRLGLMPKITPSLAVDAIYPVTTAATQASEPDDNGTPTITLTLSAPVNATELPLEDLGLYASEVISATFVDFPELEPNDERALLMEYLRKVTRDLNTGSRNRGEQHFVLVDMIRDTNHLGSLTITVGGPIEGLLPALCSLHAQLSTSDELTAALPKDPFAQFHVEPAQAELAPA